MSYLNEIVGFLALPENISHAFEIAEHIENVREKIMDDFWTSLSQKMEEYLKTNHNDWNVNAAGMQNTNTKNWFGYKLSWKAEAVHPKLNLGFGCMQEDRGGGKFYLYWQIFWLPHQFTSDPGITTPAINQIKTHCTEKKYRIDPKWSVGWDWFDFFTVHKEFCIRFANEREAIIDNIHQCVVQKFEEFRTLIQDANQELKSEIGKDNSSIKNAFALFANK